MRPLAVILGIVLGSTVSLTVGLAMSWIVLLFMPDNAAQVAAEKAPLSMAIALFAGAAALSAASFYGELKSLRWRPVAHLALLAMLGLVGWIYWPR